MISTTIVAKFVNLVLAQYTDNPIIAVLVSWPPHPLGIHRIRASNPLLRKPFIEISYRDGGHTQHAFGKQGFLRFWQETELLLQRLTDIDLTKEFSLDEMEDKAAFTAELENCLEESILESEAIFQGGMYQLFLDQYGANCKDLPPAVSARMAAAKQRLETA